MFDLESLHFDEYRLGPILDSLEDLRSTEPWDGNLLGNRRYYLPGTLSDGPALSPLSCRKAMLSHFAYHLFREAEIVRIPDYKKEYVYSRPLRGDTLLSSLDCREFPPKARYFSLDTLEGRKAIWREFDPWYSVSVIPEETYCGEGLRLRFRIHPRSPGRAAGLAVVSDGPMSDRSFPYRSLRARPLPVPDTLEVKPGTLASDGRLDYQAALRVDLEGFDSTRFRSFHVAKTLRYMRTVEDTWVKGVERAVLVCVRRDGTKITLAVSEFAGPGYMPDADIESVVVADFDGDGFEDVLVKGLYMDTRLIYLGLHGIRDSVVVQADPTEPGCC